MNTDDLYRILRVGHAQAQGIVDTIADPLLVLDGALNVQAASRSFLSTFDVDSDETIGRPLYELGNGQWNISELRHLLEQVIPKSAAVINYEVEHDFPQLGHRTMLVTARRLHDPNRRSVSMLLTIVDVTDQQRRDRTKDLLFGELRHRMKNVLGLVQSLARQTTTEGRSAEAYRDVFLGRLDALIEAEDLAFDEQEEGSVKELLDRILAPYANGRANVVIEPGPELVLKARTIMSLCLVLHEMATNAAKYGGLSAPGGEVRVSWQVEDRGRKLRLNWVESGGPPVSPPKARGFGTTLIHATTTYNLLGNLELDYAPEGFRAELVIPLGDISDDE